MGEVWQITMGQSPKGINYTNNPTDRILVQGNADMKDHKVVPRIWTKQVTKVAAKNDIILCVRAPVGDVGKTDYDVVLGRGVAGIKGPEFAYYLLQEINNKGYWKKISVGSTFESISSNDITYAKIHIPDIAEQTKIGSLFQKIDLLLTLHERKLELLKELKKAFLQLMFPDKDETVPKLRFKGFDDEWEEKKLNDIASYKSSKFSQKVTKTLLLNGRYPLFDANTELAEINCFDQEESYISIIKDGAGIGRLSLRPSHSSVISTMGYIKNINSDIYFLFCLLRTFNFKLFQVGSTIPHIYFKDYGKVKNYVPNTVEQTKIGSLFQKLDHLLTNQECKLERLKLAKNFFLQKMFI